MADEFDPCECIWSHEMVMRRLLSWIRQTQAYCTDTECIEPLPGTSREIPTDNILIMGLFLVFVMAMYFMRPSNMRSLDIDSKPRGNGNDAGGAPPTPPPATS